MHTILVPDVQARFLSCLAGGADRGLQPSPLRSPNGKAASLWPQPVEAAAAAQQAARAAAPCGASKQHNASPLACRPLLRACQHQRLGRGTASSSPQMRHGVLLLIEELVFLRVGGGCVGCAPHVADSGAGLRTLLLLQQRVACTAFLRLSCSWCPASQCVPAGADGGPHCVCVQ